MNSKGLGSNPRSGAIWYTSRMKILALIPAHNEEASIRRAIRSVYRWQTRPVDDVLVILDNCSDDTENRVDGFTKFYTVNNKNKKAGAMNQALQRILPHLDDEDYIFVMDADSFIKPQFIEKALESFKDKTFKKFLRKPKEIGAISCRFFADKTTNIVSFLQNNEYTRYSREIGREKGEVKVVTGAGGFFPVKTLKAVQKARYEGKLPGGNGDSNGPIYDTIAITEDNELSLAIKTLGYACISPKECVLKTEVMPTWKDLWLQRMRWRRGAIENIRTYGITSVTLPYILRQALVFLAILAILGLVLITSAALYFDSFGFHPIWIGVMIIMWLSQIVTVRRAGWKATLTAAIIIPDFLYDCFQQLIYIKCYFDVLRSKEGAWEIKNV